MSAEREKSEEARAVAQGAKVPRAENKEGPKSRYGVMLCLPVAVLLLCVSCGRMESYMKLCWTDVWTGERESLMRR